MDHSRCCSGQSTGPAVRHTADRREECRALAVHEDPVRAGGHTVDYRFFSFNGDAHHRALVAIDAEPTVLPAGERMKLLSWCRELCRLDIDCLTGGVQPVLLRETVFAHEALEGRLSMTDGNQLRTDVT